MRISELAECVGIPTSTVRYYERVGLLDLPARTPSGYRDYDDDAASRLLFITRARRMGLGCEQIAALVAAWDGSNCGAAHQGVVGLLEEKQAEIAARIAELEQFSHQLAAVRASLEAKPPLHVCRTDLSCCVPESPGGPVRIEILPARQGESAGGVGEGPVRSVRRP